MAAKECLHHVDWREAGECDACRYREALENLVMTTREPLFKMSGTKTKPVGRFMLFMMQVAEPIQLVYLGGSNMAWVRFMAEMNHRFGHLHFRLGGDPERTMTVMTDEEWAKRKR